MESVVQTVLAVCTVVGAVVLATVIVLAAHIYKEAREVQGKRGI
jgi:hypothetical protein